MQIDVSTLFYMTGGVSLVATMLTLWERRHTQSKSAECLWWAAGYAAIGVGCLIRVQHGALPPFVTIGLSNLGVILGYVFILVGAARFMGGGLPPWLRASSIAAAIVWIGWAWYQPVEWRTVVASLAVAVMASSTAFVLKARGQDRPLPSQSLAILLFGAHGLVYLVRAGVVVVGGPAVAGFADAAMVLVMMEGMLWGAAGPASLLSLVRERSERRLLSASETDFLTGLDNRRAFARRAEALLEKGGPGQGAAGLLLFDLDHFKSINDRHGHQTGDEVLRVFARILQSEARPHDVVARLGGEEFALLLADDDASRPEAIAGAVARRLAQATLAMSGFERSVTASAGYARADGAGVDDLVAVADTALYRAKSNGRNRLERVEPAEVTTFEGQARPLPA